MYARTGDSRDSYRVWVGKMPLVRPRRRWKDNIKMVWLRAGTGGRLHEHGNEPSVSIKFWEFLEWVRNSYLLRTNLDAWGSS